MTIKTLTHNYPGGYTLNGAKYAGLTIGRYVEVYGTGVAANSYATIRNDGRVIASSPDPYSRKVDGLYMNDGGSVTNGSSSAPDALIEGSYYGIQTKGVSTSIANFGTIQGGGFAGYGGGVYLGAGGSIVNGSSTDGAAKIFGETGVLERETPISLANFGTISGEGVGARLSGGGLVTNGSVSSKAALIVGFQVGVLMDSSGTIANFGTIKATGTPSNAFDLIPDGVDLLSGALTNGSAGDSAALIEGDNGVSALIESISIANFGTVEGTGRDGIYLFGGGRVTNGSSSDHAALIEGYYSGVKEGYIDGVAPAAGSISIANFGTIEGTSSSGAYSCFGIFLSAGGRVANGSSTDGAALIAGYALGMYSKGPTTIINFGTVEGTYGYGVTLAAGGRVINGSATEAKASIEGYVGVKTAGGTITNFGTIEGTGKTAVTFTAPGVLIAEADSVFKGAVDGDGGMLRLGAGPGMITSLASGDVIVTGGPATSTFTNFGSLEVDSDAAFTLTGTGTIAAGATDTLTATGGFTLTGTLLESGTINGGGTVAFVGGGAAIDTGAVIKVAHWSLTGGTTTLAESLAYAGAFSEGAGGTLTLDAGKKLALSDATSLAGKINGAGTLELLKATLIGLTVNGTGLLEAAGTVTTATGANVIAEGTKDTGSISVTGGTLDLTGAVTGDGSLAVGDGATLEIGSGVASTLGMSFSVSGGVLELSDPGQFAATISGFDAGDTLDLLNRIATSAKLGAGDTLVITNGATAVTTLKLAGTYTGDTFAVASDGHGGSDIKVSTGAGGVHPFVAAMACLAPAAGGSTGAASDSHPRAAQRPTLATPGLAQAI